MTTAAADLLAIWRNPVFNRYRRSRLRWRRSIFWYLLTLIVTTFVLTLTYTLKVNAGATSESAARDLWLPLIIIQGLILMVKGTGAASAGIIQDKIDGTLDYQRLTPMSPLGNLIGYLYGLPVLEYAMAALTLPHLVFALVVGHVPMAAFLKVYIAFLVCVTLYHMTGIAVGIVMKRWIVGYLLSIFMVLMVNLFLPTVVSQFGLKFVQFLSVWPVIGQEIIPLVVPPQALQLALQNPWFATASEVAFYQMRFTAFDFTLTMQGALIVTFAVMALRRWQSSTRHSLSKPYALAFLTGFIVILTGNVWPAITGQYVPFAIFGETEIEELAEVIAIAFPVVYAFVTWALTFTLFAMVVPDRDECIKGLRRAAKAGHRALAPWSDDAASVGFMALFVVVVLVGYATIDRAIFESGFFDFMTRGTAALWPMPVALALALLCTLLLIQVVELKPAMLVVLLVWFVPILVAIVLSAITESAETMHAIVASVSPVALVAMSGALPATDAMPAEISRSLDVLQTGITSGLAFVSLQIGLLGWLWRQRLVAIRAAAYPPAQPADVESRDPASAQFETLTEDTGGTAPVS